MKKAVILFFVALLCSYGASAQIPQIQWQKALGGTNYEWAYSLIQTYNSGYGVAGFSLSNNGDVTGNHGFHDYWVVKLDSSGTIEWQKSLGGTGQDRANSIFQTSDSGYVVAGSSESNDGDVSGHHGSTGYSDYWVVKLNGTGTIDWQISLGGTGVDVANSIIQTSDSGYIVAGYSFSNDGDVSGHHGTTNYSDYWVVKLDAAGTIDWQKSLGGTGHDRGNSIIQTSDSGYVIAGYSESNNGDVTGNNGAEDYWVVRLNATGTILWQQSLGGTSSDYAFSIVETVDSGYAVAGYSYSNNGDVTGNHGDADYWLVKLNSSGAIQWEKSLGGTVTDQAYSTFQTSDSGYVVAGATLSNDGDVSGNHGGWDYWVVKLNASGTLEWQKTLGGTWWDKAFSIIQTSNSQYVVAGYTESTNGDVTGNHGGNDYWVVKFGDTTGINIIPPVISLSSSDTVMCEKQCIDFYDLSTNNPTSWQWFFPGADSTTSTLQNPTNICYNQYGSFDVTLIACNAAGCDTLYLPGFINEYQTLTPVITQSNDTLFSSPGVAYQWWSVDSGIIAGATNNYFIPTQGGSYFVIATDSNGCNGASNTIIITALNSPLERGWGCVITPNPNNGSFTISFNEALHKDFSLRILNSIGQTINNCQWSIVNGQKAIVNLPNAVAGLYAVEVITREKVYRQKFVLSTTLPK